MRQTYCNRGIIAFHPTGGSRTLELQHILAFLTLTEELHFGRAADRLYVTQPTLSRNIKSLEDELGARLFERANNRVSLTEAGNAFLDPARAVRDSHARAVNSISQSSRRLRGTVRLVFTGPSSYQLVSDLTSEVSERHPGIHLELLGGGFAGEGLHRLLNNTADAALGRWSKLPESIDSVPLRAEGFVLAVPSMHPLASRREVPFSAVVDEPFIRLSERLPSILTERLDDLCTRYSARLNVRQTAPESWTALALVAAGVGITLTLTSVRDNVSVPGVSFLELTDPLEQAWLRLAWNTQLRTPALASVVACATDISGVETA